MELRDIGTTAAIILGVVNLWYGVLLPRWKNRRAKPDGRLELVSYQLGPEKWDQDERIVLTNCGPADMKDVAVIVRDDAGSDFTAGIGALFPKQPIKNIFAQQSVHFKLAGSIESPRPGSMLVSWKDGRPDRQEVELSLSYHRVT
jgi:hypothetical protein